MTNEEFLQKHGRQPNQPAYNYPGAPAPQMVHPEDSGAFDHQEFTADSINPEWRNDESSLETRRISAEHDDKNAAFRQRSAEQRALDRIRAEDARRRR